MEIETPHPPDALKYIEDKYPETARMFEEIQHDQYLLFCKKQSDYGPANIAMGTQLANIEDKRLSMTALIIRLNDKINRLINLVIKENKNPQNESVIDAFSDISVYGIIAMLVDRDVWGK
tara:strand:+ start:54 stop:413 length:360 start_codon:yes stop_codon:yes gene_type:complete